jgi:hypothetical protein
MRSDALPMSLSTVVDIRRPFSMFDSLMDLTPRKSPGKAHLNALS